MGIDLTIKIGGEAGQGIQTVGQLLALVCREAGLYVMGINDFESRIRGGHSFFQLRISDVPIHAPHHRVHILVAMDDNTVTLHKDQVVAEGTILVPIEQKVVDSRIVPVHYFELAESVGSPITANAVAAGSTL
ncbi:MAG: 2-oxoacid:acceptor oxidoreductase family protein, partial [Pseudomonadota bacterium]